MTNENSNKQLTVVYYQRSSLIEYAKNARTHSDEQVKQIANSIDYFGWTNPVLIDENSEIIAGHGRVLAAESLNIDDIPCIVLTGLSDEQKRAYRIADNKLSLNSGWDDALLSEEIESLIDIGFDITLTGFDPSDFAIPDFSPGTEDDQGKLDEMAPKLCPHCGGEL